jgi:hypothetical protein
MADQLLPVAEQILEEGKALFADLETADQQEDFLSYFDAFLAAQRHALSELAAGVHGAGDEMAWRTLVATLQTGGLQLEAEPGTATSGEFAFTHAFADPLRQGRRPEALVIGLVRALEAVIRLVNRLSKGKQEATSAQGPVPEVPPGQEVPGPTFTAVGDSSFATPAGDAGEQGARSKRDATSAGLQLEASWKAARQLVEARHGTPRCYLFSFIAHGQHVFCKWSTSFRLAFYSPPLSLCLEGLIVLSY